MQDALVSIKIETNKKENFLLINDKKKKVVMFSTILNLTFLCQLATVFVDRTSYSCPKQFAQLFTIVGLSQNLYILLVSFLLFNKRIDSYATAFSYIASECKKVNLTFNTKITYADFEISIHSAIRSVFSDRFIIKGCRFHLAQSWWRKIQQLGLSTEYKDVNSEIGAFLKNFFGLAFLDPVDVVKCFVEDLKAIQPEDERVQEFCEYIWNTYVASDSNFPPHIWAEFCQSITRTTNGCESYHSKLNAEFYSANPNIFNFTKVLKEIQIDVYIKMTSVGKRSEALVEKEQFLIDNMQVGFIS